MRISIKKLVAVALIAAGTLALAYGGFTYTEKEHDVKLGKLEFAVEEKKRVDVPVWLGVAGIAAGVFLLVLGDRRS